MTRRKSKKSRGLEDLTLNERFFYPHPPPDWSLIVERNDPRLDLNWPPQGFENRDCPLNDSLDALRQWFDFLIRPGGVVLCGGTFGLTADSWNSWMRDTLLLIEHHRERGTVTLATNIKTTHNTPVEAIEELIRVRDAIFPKVDCPLPLPDTKGSALAIIKALPKGQGTSGKGIVAALKKSGIAIAETYFRRHIVPYLKTQGVKNHRSRGGYYLP